MKSNLTLMLAITFAGLSLSVSAAQPPNSNIEYLRPADLNRSQSQIPGSAHGHVSNDWRTAKAIVMVTV